MFHIDTAPVTSLGCLQCRNKTVPVAIVGAGPVGLMLALRLAQNQIRSVVLERAADLNRVPKAMRYYGPVNKVFLEAGIYERIAKESIQLGGYAWRKTAEDVYDSNGEWQERKLGDIIGRNVMSRPEAGGSFRPGFASLQLQQWRLTEIMLDEALKTGLVDVLWNREVKGISQDDEAVTITTSSPNGETQTLKAQYLAGCDGARSSVRKLLNIPFAGHSWPERLMAVEILRKEATVPEPPVHFTCDPKYWAVITPLEHGEPNQPTMWRYTMAVPARVNEDGEALPPLSDEEVLDPKYIDSLLQRQLDGANPSNYEIKHKCVYPMHQLLAGTMHRGRCFLAGDAAHVNNPIGGLGLCTGLLDADALHQALKIAFSFRPGKQEIFMPFTAAPALQLQSNPISVDPQAVFARYSCERRRVFQNVIHPISSANKIRLHGSNPDDMARDDWYLQALNSGDPMEMQAVNGPLMRDWRTDMWSFLPKWIK